MPEGIRKDLWERIEKKRISYESWAVRVFQKSLMESIRGVFENLEQFGARDALSELENEFEIKPIQEAYQDVYERVGTSFADQNYRAFKSQKDEGAVRQGWVEFMREFALTEAGERIKEVQSTTLKKIRKTLETGVQEGQGIEEIARNMQQSTGVSRVRARRIARTEIVSASNQGTIIGLDSTGLNLQKEWISTFDSRTREDHAMADGQKTGLHDHFWVGGEQLRYPGDPNGSAGNVINCRCATAGIEY